MCQSLYFCLFIIQYGCNRYTFYTYTYIHFLFAFLPVFSSLILWNSVLCKLYLWMCFLSAWKQKIFWNIVLAFSAYRNDPILDFKF